MGGKSSLLGLVYLWLSVTYGDNLFGYSIFGSTCDLIDWLNIKFSINRSCCKDWMFYDLIDLFNVEFLSCYNCYYYC